MNEAGVELPPDIAPLVKDIDLRHLIPWEFAAYDQAEPPGVLKHVQIAGQLFQLCAVDQLVQAVQKEKGGVRKVAQIHVECRADVAAQKVGIGEIVVVIDLRQRKPQGVFPLLFQCQKPQRGGLSGAGHCAVALIAGLAAEQDPAESLLRDDLPQWGAGPALIVVPFPIAHNIRQQFGVDLGVLNVIDPGVMKEPHHEQAGRLPLAVQPLGHDRPALPVEHHVVP